MGVPRYPESLGDVLRTRIACGDVLAAASAGVNGYPWIPWTVSPAQQAMWACTVSGSWEGLYTVAGWRTHPSLSLSLIVVAPADGCQVRILADDDATVLWGPESFTAGSHSVPAVAAVSGDYYTPTYVAVQALSTSPGQPTAVAVGRAAGSVV
jgi:hypothetical protein